MLNSETTFSRQCKGRNAEGNTVLEKAINIQVTFSTHAENDENIYGKVTCEHIRGGHGQRCKASHPEVDKVGKGIICPYSLDIPHALEHLNEA